LKEKFLVPPTWLNKNDAANAAKALSRSIVSAESRDGNLMEFMHYLGVQDLSLDAVLAASHSNRLSKIGCVEVASFSIRNAFSGGYAKSAAEAPIWIGAGEAQSLTSMARDGAALSTTSIEQLNAAGISNTELEQFVRIAVGGAVKTLVTAICTAAPTPSVFLTTEPATTAAPMPTPTEFDPLLAGAPSVSPSTKALHHPAIETKFLPAWRGAEQYVAQVLQSHGYIVEDRSRQNLGYDLYVAKDNRKYYIEVKLLDYTGQPFVITPNEEAVARECGEGYALALTLRGKDGVHIQFVHDPVAKLKFVRQCRQWVWECSEYEFQSHYFEGND
jgi:hypothetical protein